MGDSGAEQNISAHNRFVERERELAELVSACETFLFPVSGESGIARRRWCRASKTVQGLARAIATSFATIALVAALPALSMAQTVKMSGTITSRVSAMTTVGHLDPLKQLTLDVRFALRNRAELQHLLAAQITPGSPGYHQWITPQEFDRRFGANERDFASVKKWLGANRFQIIGGSRAEGYIRFLGNVATAEHAFNTRLDDFGDGKFANVTEPEIPARFAGVIGDILGMQNLGYIQPAFQASKLKQPIELAAPKRDMEGESVPDFFFPPFGPSFIFGPPDFHAFYNENPLLNAGNTGASSNDCIGIFASSNIFPEPSQATILTDYFQFFSQYTAFSTIPSVTIDLSSGSDPGVGTIFPLWGGAGDGEAYLDIEAAHTIAPGAPITLYVVDFKRNFDAFFDGVTAMTRENKCSVLSFSSILCHWPTSYLVNTLGDLFLRAQANGQSVFVASGDAGSDTCGAGFPNVNELAANPFVTAVGGTEAVVPPFDDNGFATGYSYESAWEHGGGGISALFKKPWWQVGVPGTSNDHFRDLPDVAALSGEPGMLEAWDSRDAKGKPSPVPVYGRIGGTSLSAPLWAGFARVLQSANGGKRLGSLNPIIWKLGQQGSEASGFHDITSGSNTTTRVNRIELSVPGYSAAPGYDMVTGWGSIDANAFVPAYVNAEAPPPTTVPSKLGGRPATIKFASSTVGVPSKAKTLVLLNQARKGGAPITLSGLATTANIRASGGTCIAGQAIAAKQSCTLSFTMTPSSAGNNSGRISILSNSNAGPLMIDASMRGKAPR